MVRGVPFPPWYTDVRVVYEPFGQRWIATADVLSFQTNKPALLLAVSATSDPTGAWYGFNLPASPTNGWDIDSPLIGFSLDKVVVSLDITRLSNYQDQEVGIYIFGKTNLYSGVMSNQYIFSPALNGYSLAPTCSYDATSSVYLVNDYGYNTDIGSSLGIYSITGSFGSYSLTHLGNAKASASAWANFAPAYLNSGKAEVDPKNWTTG